MTDNIEDLLWRVLLLWRVHNEAEALLRDLERIETANAGDLALAGRYIAVMTAHIEPLRRVVEDVEFHERANAVIDTLNRSK